MPKMVKVNGVRVRETDAKRYKFDPDKATAAHVPGAVKPKPGSRNRLSDPRIDQLEERLETVTAELAELRAIVESDQDDDAGAEDTAEEKSDTAEAPAEAKPKPANSRKSAGK